MRWLIVEDALRDRKGHWFEYLGTFSRELQTLGDDVTVLADRAAEPFVIERLQARPILPPSIWHRMGDNAGVIRRYLRVPHHAWETYRVMNAFLNSEKRFDVIFVPTILVHHLLAWTWLIKRILSSCSSKVLLFFPNTPILIDSATNLPHWLPGPSAKLFCSLIRKLKSEVAAGKVILGAETESMREALSGLTGVPFVYFPHPVQPPPSGATVQKAKDRSVIRMASYGGMRSEKGCDLLVEAVEEYCRRNPNTRVRFILQTVGGDPSLWKRFEGNPIVQLIPAYFQDGEYAQHLQATDVMLLPYRRSSYDLRVSRVVIEAMIHGVPVIATDRTTLASQAREFGAAVCFTDGNVDGLLGAIGIAEKRIQELSDDAQHNMLKCARHFSVSQFRDNLTAIRSHSSE